MKKKKLKGAKPEAMKKHAPATQSAPMASTKRPSGVGVPGKKGGKFGHLKGVMI